MHTHHYTTTPHKRSGKAQGHHPLQHLHTTGARLASPAAQDAPPDTAMGKASRVSLAPLRANPTSMLLCLTSRRAGR